MPLLNFSSNFKVILYGLSLLRVLIKTLIVCKILKFQPDTYIAGSPKKNIYCLINNRTKDFCQNFKLYIFWLKKHQDFNFETKIIGIRLKLSEIYFLS